METKMIYNNINVPDFEDVLSAYLEGERGKNEEMKSILETLELERKNLHTFIKNWMSIKNEGIQSIQNASDPESRFRSIIFEIFDDINMGRVNIVLHFCFSIIKANNPPLQMNEVIQITSQVARQLQVDKWIQRNDGWKKYLRQKENGYFKFSIIMLLSVIVVVFLFKSKTLFKND